MSLRSSLVRVAEVALGVALGEALYGYYIIYWVFLP